MHREIAPNACVEYAALPTLISQLAVLVMGVQNMSRLVI